MPREFGGNTPLGVALNKAGSLQDGTRAGKVNKKYGIIKEVIGRKMNQGVYTVILELIGPNGASQGLTKPIPLQEHPSFLAANYGPPEELVGRFMCRVDYSGTSVNRGQATIIRPFTNDKEITEQTNQIQITGAAFAPPGSGMM